MKTHKIVTIALLSGIVIGLAAGLALVLSGSVSFFGWTRDGGGNWLQAGAGGDLLGRSVLQKETELDTEGINEISIMLEGTPYDIYFLPAQNNKIRVAEYYNKKMTDNEFATIIIENGKISISQEAFNNFSFWGINSLNGYIQVYIPAEAWLKLAKVDVTTSSGEIDIPEFETDNETGAWKTVKLNSSSGDIHVQKINGDLTTESNSGDQSVQYVAGEFLAASSSGGIEILSTEGNVQTKSASGNQRIDSVGGDLITVSSSGDQTVGNVAGNASMTSQSGDQKISGAGGSLTMTSSSGRLEAGTAGGKAVLSSQSGDQYIKEAVRDLEMNSTSGELEVETVKGTAVMKSSSGNQKIKSLSGGGEFQTSSGDIFIGVSSLEGNISTLASSGDTEITLPSNSSFLFKAITSSGTLKTSYDNEITYDEKRKKGEGTVGANAQYAITGESTSGGISIR